MDENTLGTVYRYEGSGSSNGKLYFRKIRETTFRRFANTQEHQGETEVRLSGLGNDHIGIIFDHNYNQFYGIIIAVEGLPDEVFGEVEKLLRYKVAFIS